ncbi:MAG: PqqD family protein [Deltaproteobacteria bacterium]|nr:PqqD family protein [Deltaproteobacteria bacterium]
MRVFKKKRGGTEITRAQALNSIPVKSEHVRESRLENGDALLTYPVRTKPWMAGIVRFLGGSSEGVVTKKLQLDALGTAVWERIDGRRSVRRMVREFIGEHQLHPKEAEVAVTRFLRDLGKRGLIGLK